MYIESCYSRQLQIKSYIIVKSNNEINTTWTDHKTYTIKTQQNAKLSG